MALFQMNGQFEVSWNFDDNYACFIQKTANLDSIRAKNQLINDIISIYQFKL